MAIDYDIGAYLKTEFALIPAVHLSSGLATTATLAEVNGPAYDRFDNTSRMHSVKVCVPVQVVLTSGIDASIVANLQHANTTVSTDFANFGSTANSLSWVGATGGQTIEDTLEWDVSLLTARRYLRVQVTPTLGTTGVSNAVRYSGVFVFGGGDVLPAA